MTDTPQNARGASIWKSVRRFFSALSQPGTGGLIQPGDWRCRYTDGKCTHYMSHGDAANLMDIFGGKLEWRYDQSAPEGRAGGQTRAERDVDCCRR